MPPADGIAPASVRAAVSAGVCAVPYRSPLATSTAPGDWWVPVVCVGFTDSTLKYTGDQVAAAILDTTHATATGSVPDYYAWATRGQVHFRGEVVGTVVLPHPESWYGADANGLNVLATPNNDCGLVRDVVAALDTSVDWNRYDRDGDGYVDMVWLVHAGIGGEATKSRQSLWSVTSRLSQGWSGGSPYETKTLVPNSTTRHVRVDRFTILPQISGFVPGAMCEIGPFCHEFGHALGLPDLYDTSTLGLGPNVGPGNWSLMSTGVYGGDGLSPQYPVHMGGWALEYLGLAPLQRPAQDTLLTMEPLSRGGPVYDLSFQGEQRVEHYILEARYREGFDRNLPGSGLIITQLDDGLVGLRMVANRVISTLQPAYRVLEGDGDFDLVVGQNHGDAGDVFPGSHSMSRIDDDTSPSLRTFAGAPTNLSIDTIRRAVSATIAYLHVNAPGWLAVEDPTEAGFAPVTGPSRGRHALMDSRGGIVEVFSDSRTGVPQVRMRTRSPAGAWSASTQVTESPVAAYDPAIAPLPDGGLALAWTDLRGGAPQVYTSAFQGGVWGPAWQASAPAGTAMVPAIASDSTGRILLVWLDTSIPNAAVRFTTFLPGATSDTVKTATQPTDLPLAPTLAAAPDGRAWIAWPDQGSGDYRIRFASWSPLSGMSLSQALTPSSFTQPEVSVTADSGAVLFAWVQITSGLNEIHYARYDSAYAMNDTVLATSAETLQDPDVAFDRQRGVHVVFSEGGSSGQQVRYLRWRDDHGWDAYPTDLSDPSRGSAGRLAVLPFTHGNVSVLYVDNSGPGAREQARTRALDSPFTSSVPPVAVARPLLRLGPCPLVAGAELRATGEALAGGGALELFDAAGRRVASARVQGGYASFGGATTRALGPGLYFARAGGGAVARVVVLR